MAKGIRLQTKILAVILPIAIVVGVASFIFAPPEEFLEFTTFLEDDFELLLSPPPSLSVVATGAESFLIKCTIQNTVDVRDTDGVLRQRVTGTDQFSPAIALDFLISTSAMEQFGRADAKTTISCNSNSLASQGFGAFLYDGFITTTITGVDFDGNNKQLVSKTRQVSGLTDLTGKSNVELNSLTVSVSTLNSVLKDDKSYPALIKVTAVGELLFRQCVTGEFCTAVDRNASWIHLVSGGDVFTAFGLIVEGAEFAPTTSIQELIITDSRLESVGNKINIVDSNRIDFKIRVKDYQAGLDSIPSVKLIEGSSGTVRQIQSAGILTQTEEGGAFHVRDMTFRIPNSETGLWCFELQRDESGVRTASKKCVTIYTGDNVETETESGTDPTTTADISSGEVRLRYEITTTGNVIQNDITKAGGIPITFIPAQLAGITGDKANILKIWLQPQIFFSEGVIDDLNIISGSANIEYTGKIKLPEDTVTINALDLRPNAQDFTKNQASIILPSTSITTAEIEKLIVQQSTLPTGVTPITLEIVASGTFQLAESGGAQQLGTFDNAKFSFNIDYIPPKDTTGDNTDTCNGTVIAGVCIDLGDDQTIDETKCFDASGNQVECSEDNDPNCMAPEVEVAGICVLPEAGETEQTQCFDSNGDVIDCQTDVDVDCDPNTDPDRCGGGGFQGNPETDPPMESEAGESFICDPLIGTFLECAEAGADLVTPTPFELDFGGQLTNVAIVVGAGIALIIVIAIIIRVVKNR